MPVIKPSCVRDLKLRANIVDVVSRVATLRRAGARFKALCPFHNEKTPSFNVDPNQGFYKCFGCGKAGDIISFVRETEQLSFTEAVETLGRRFGIAIEYEEGSGPTREERSLRQELYDLHEQAADFYHEAFKGGGIGEKLRAYWTEQRRFPLELAAEFKIGAAAPDDAGLASRLLQHRFSEDALRQCGLFFIRDGAPLRPETLRPRFRGRLMIPIRDHQGRVVAFTARQTPLTPGDDPSSEAKYVNSPETPIFTKGHLLFNLDRSRTQVGPGKPFVLVEGQLDALRCWQVGLRTAVAPQGTAITEGQLNLLRRYHPEIECFFDSDSAGQKAALRLLPLALKTGLEVRFLRLEGAEKLDPDLLFLERGLAAYQQVRDGALSAMGYLRHHALPRPEEATPETTARAVEQIYEVIASADSEVLQQQLLAEVAPAIGAWRILPHVFQADFAKFARRRAGRSFASQASGAPPAGAAGPGHPPAITPEQHLLIVCLHHEEMGKALSTVLPHDWIDTGHPAGVLLNRFLGEFEHGEWPGRDHLDPLLTNAEEKALVASPFRAAGNR
jgi:DNA primase